jgi:rod shape-determining protein MreC
VPRKKTKLLIYLFFILAIFLLLFFPAGSFSPLSFSVIKITSLPIKIISYPFLELKKILFYHRTFKEYKRLREEVTTLTARLAGLDEVLLENSRLAKLLDFKRNLLFSSVAANVVGRDPANWNATVILDKGKEDGIDMGMPVVSALGVVGKIAEVGQDTAKAILLSDPSFSVVALVKRSREVGLISGTLQGMSRMRYLSANADVQVGDQIITSKLSSSFPEGILIGDVVEVRSSGNSPAMECIVRPAVSLSQVEEVLVIQKPQ